MTQVTLNKGGQAEKIVEAESLQIHDLWNISFQLPDEQGQLVRDVWHLAHDMKRHIVEEPVRSGHPYKVTVQKMIAFGRVHELDEHIEGEYPFCAINEEDALDQFHLTVPVKVLEDFAITAEPVQ